jgi:hypothetical protein
VIDEKLFKKIFAAQGKSFRGTAEELVKDAPLGKGHGNDGMPLDLETCCYLKPVFAEWNRARQNSTRLKMVVLAGVKTLKSLTGEIFAADHVCNASGDFAIFFGTEKTADAGSTTRILSYFRGIPLFARKMESMSSRFDDTKGKLAFPDKTLFILAANMSNTQQKNLGGIAAQDCFIFEPGLIGEMLARTTQYHKEALIYLESQGGEKGCDFDKQYLDTDQRELHVICPHCGKPHVFNWKAYDEELMTRPEQFMPTPPMIIPSLDHQAWIEHNRPLLLSEDRRVAGFRRGDDKLIKNEDGSYNETAILRETHFECFQCGSVWKDDGEFGATRIALDRSSHYIATRYDAQDCNIGFNIPQWINRRLSWGEIMVDKLKSQKVSSELGNFGDIKQWWQKRAARTWDEKLNARQSERAGASIYEIGESKLPGEKVRISATDIQFKMTHMVYLAVAVGDGTPPWVLHFEWIKPPSGLTDAQMADFCKNRVRALDKQFLIQPINSMKDVAHESGMVMEWAAEDAVWGKTHQRERAGWKSYGLLRGDDRPSYLWKHEGRKSTWERFKEYHNYKIQCFKNGKHTLVEVHQRLWSNPSIKEIAERWIQGFNAPKLQIHEKFLRDTSKDGLWQQLNSEQKLPKKNNAEKLVYQKLRPENHAWDCLCMIFVRMDELGYLNSFGAPPEDTGD